MEVMQFHKKRMKSSIAHCKRMPYYWFFFRPTRFEKNITGRIDKGLNSFFKEHS